MASSGEHIDAHLLMAILKVAREECQHEGWEALEPILAAAWEELREADTPPWEIVADEIQRACRRDGMLD
jgi:hypothetical protein